MRNQKLLNNKKLIVIIPAYNEEATIKKVIEAAFAITEVSDVVVVNDCSKDGTAAEVLKTKAHLITLPVNLGIGGGMQTGYRYAKRNNFDYAVQVDGDGQHNPSEIKKLLNLAREADLVIGSRFVKKSSYKSSFSRRFGIGFFSIVTKFLIGTSIKDATSGFRLANRRVINYFASNYPSDYPEPEVLVGLSKRGFRIKEVPVQMNIRETGKSSITSLRSVYYMIKVVFAMLIEKIRRK